MTIVHAAWRSRRTGLGQRVGVAITACALLLLAGCAPAPPSDAPEGLTVSIYQTRTDLAERELEVSVTNDTGSDLTVTGLSVTARQFAEPMTWPKSSTSIRAGVTADLPVQLAPVDCDAEPGKATVALEYSLADGRTGTALLTPSDPNARLDGIRGEDCLLEAVSEIVTIDASTPPRHEIVGDTLVARYDLTLTPTGSTGSVTIESAGGNILIGLVDADAVPTPLTPLGLLVDSTDPPSVLTLSFVPGRCDEHAILEDKRGTLVPLHVTTDDGSAGTLFVAPTEPVKQAIYDFVRTACALTPRP